MKIVAPFIDAKAYASNKPFPHGKISTFLNEEAVQELLLALEEETFYEKDSDLFSFLQSNDLQGSSNKKIKEFIALMTSEETVRKIEEMTQTKISRKKVDVQASVYEDTDFLLCHDDQLDSRVVAFIYYLSSLSEKEGGALRLYFSKNNMPLADSFVDVQPEENSIVFFTVSKTSYHEVREVIGEMDRIAIGGWFHEAD